MCISLDQHLFFLLPTPEGYNPMPPDYWLGVSVHLKGGEVQSEKAVQAILMPPPLGNEV